MWQELIILGFAFLLGWVIRGESLPYKTKYNCPKCKKQRNRFHLLVLQEELNKTLALHKKEHPEDFTENIDQSLKEATDNFRKNNSHYFQGIEQYRPTEEVKKQLLS